MGGKLVVGLGNPGPEYERTWHNLGFHVIRALAKRLKMSFKSHPGALVAKSGGERGVTLLLPQDYMNLSGPRVAKWARKLGVFEEQILVVLDDHDLPRGLLRMRASGGDGGHRGLRSVLDELGTDSVPRLRIGIRDEKRDPETGGYRDLAERVLAPWDECEEKHVSLITREAVRAVLDWIHSGTAVAMNRHNNKRVLPPEEGTADQRGKSGKD